MQKPIKILLIIVGFVITVMIMGLLKEENGREGGGPIGLIIMFAFFAGARAIWRYKSPTKNKQDNHELDKS